MTSPGIGSENRTHWKVACRTDTHGYLRLLPPISGPQRPEAAWRDVPVDSLPTVFVNLGAETGLWWTYSWRELLIEFQGPGRRIARERQLQRISTYVEENQLPAFEALVHALDRATGEKGFKKYQKSSFAVSAIFAGRVFKSLLLIREYDSIIQTVNELCGGSGRQMAACGA
jgi:hypothetical protein